MNACRVCGRPDPTVTLVEIPPTEYLRDALVAVLSSEGFQYGTLGVMVEDDDDLANLLFQSSTEFSARKGRLAFSVPDMGLVTIQMISFNNPFRYVRGEVAIWPWPPSGVTQCRACDLERFIALPRPLSDVELHALTVAVQTGGEPPDAGRVAALNAELQRRGL